VHAHKFARGVTASYSPDGSRGCSRCHPTVGCRVKVGRLNPTLHLRVKSRVTPSLHSCTTGRADIACYGDVLTDETIPDLTGTELARELRQLRPEIPIILMSGYSGPQLGERAQAARIVDVLRKSLIRRDIAEPVARALRRAALRG
jgi:CheY-like chemotaxis protein